MGKKLLLMAIKETVHRESVQKSYELFYELLTYSSCSFYLHYGLYAFLGEEHARVTFIYSCMSVSTSTRGFKILAVV